MNYLKRIYISTFGFHLSEFNPLDSYEKCLQTTSQLLMRDSYLSISGVDCADSLGRINCCNYLQQIYITQEMDSDGSDKQIPGGQPKEVLAKRRLEH